MPATHVNWPAPLQRLNPWYPGQLGVPGTDTRTGLRMHSTGTVFYVDPNAIGVSDGRDGTDPGEPLATIAAAIAKCQPYRGDTIAVMANNSWQYGNALDGNAVAISEEVVLDVPGVRLVGICPSGMGVYWTPIQDGGTCITVAAMDCLIEGFVFWEGVYNGCNAIYCEWGGPIFAFGENLTVRHCVFDETVDIAIQLEYAWYCEIHNCIFWNCQEYGIYVDTLGSGVRHTLIHDNLFHFNSPIGTPFAISLLGGSDYNTIYRNSFYNAQAQAGAAATNEGIDTTGGDFNQVFDNWFSCLLPAAAPGDWDDLNTGAATDAWIGNHCMNGLAVGAPT